MNRSLIILAIALAPLAAGCGQNAQSLFSQNQWLARNNQTAVQQGQELQTRLGTMDRDNQELQALVAQSKQQNQLLKDQLDAVREQLRVANTQLAQTRTDKDGLERHTQALAASAKRQAAAGIHANNSLTGKLSVITLPGVEIRQDGDVIRIELPGEKLFAQGSATMIPGAVPMLDGTVAEVLKAYPHQIIGIEGHTDSDPINTPQFPSNHHLSTARAMAVYDHLTRAFNVPSGQLFVVGHGANHPVVSNATPAGKARNRRIELVVYPEARP